jgi:hypothetical protein
MRQTKGIICYFVIVGGWVYNLYAPPRMTGDINFFIDSYIGRDKHLLDLKSLADIEDE